MTTPHKRRIIWFADLEALIEDIGVLEVLRDEAGLTTIAPESHISHTSGFRASPATVANGPLEAWASQPGMIAHREIFGNAEPAMAVLPGVVGGVDDAPLLRVIEECRRLEIEVWGHAGMWCYGADVFPELAATDLLGRSVLPASLPWGTMFCPSVGDLNAWIAESLAEATRTYDLDGWFLDHARYPSPGFAAGLLACACPRCAETAVSLGVDIDDCRRDVMALAEALGGARPAEIEALADAGPTAWQQLLGRFPGVRVWLDVRATILANRFGRIGEAVMRAADRPIEFGSDVFPPSVALLGGHDYAAWARSATYMSGGFGPKIGWGSVVGVTATALGQELAALVPGLSEIRARQVVARALGAPGDVDATPTPAATRREMTLMATVRPDVPVYPPMPKQRSNGDLSAACAAIVEAGLDGVMVAGLESSSPEQRRILRKELSERLA